MIRSRNNRFSFWSIFKAIELAVTLATLGFFCSSTFATQSVTLGWNPGTDSGIAGYAVYYGTTNGTYSKRIDVGTNTSAVVSGLAEGQTNYFAVAAYNVANMEGTASPALTFIVPGYLQMSTTAPSGMSFPVSPGHFYTIQATTNFTSWTNVWQTATATSNAWISYQDPQAGTVPLRFYRLVLH